MTQETKWLLGIAEFFKKRPKISNVLAGNDSMHAGNDP